MANIYTYGGWHMVSHQSSSSSSSSSTTTSTTTSSYRSDLALSTSYSSVWCIVTILSLLTVCVCVSVSVPVCLCVYVRACVRLIFWRSAGLTV